MPQRRALVAGLSAVVAAIATACGPSPTSIAPTPTTVIIVVNQEDDWARVKAAGRLMVGTSGDYAPWESYNAQRQLDGFDIALMKRIADRLGVKADFSDFAFEGLGGALQLKQVDSAIAAISVTPDRQQVLDFSDVYFVSEEAVLANADSPITSIADFNDLAGKRIGVESGSVYETGLQKNAVQTGIIPQNSLASYVHPDQAVRDLRAKKIDLVVLGALPALDYAAQGGVKVVERGKFPQSYAIALRKGSTLTPQINAALRALQNDGTIAALAKAYLKLDAMDALPPATPAPVPLPTRAAVAPPSESTSPGSGVIATSTPPPPCIDGMAWVADLSYPDNNMTSPPVLAPGQAFKKGWRLRNAGTCTWSVGYTMRFVSGSSPEARMGGQPTAVPRAVVPGDTVDIFVDLVAPLKPGTYQAFWQMYNGVGTAFGQRVWVGISVPAPATPTPFATPTPSANVSFRASSTAVVQGECVTFNWSANNVNAVYFYQEGQPYQPNGVAGQGQRTVCPQTTTTYYLRVELRDGTATTYPIQIVVTPAAAAPQITQFSIVPEGNVSLGACIDIYWATANASGTRLSVNGASLWENAPTNGTFRNCPPAVGTYNYTLEATGPGGANRSDRSVNVVQSGPSPTPIPPQAPSIISFVINPTVITFGQCASIGWSVVNADYIRLIRNGAVVLDNAQPSESIQNCSSEVGTATFVLEATRTGAQPATATGALTTNPGAQPPEGGATPTRAP